MPPLEMVEQMLGVRPQSARPVGNGGYTNAQRWLVELPDGTGAFVKVGDDPMLRVEVRVYRAIDGPFLPALLGSYEDEHVVALAVEDLSGALWPPPYPEDVSSLFDAVAQVGRTPPPEGLPVLRPRESTLWEQVAAAPEPFLELGACSRDWLKSALPTLVDAERRAPRVGDDLVHYDVWGGNLCFRDGRAVLVDWGAAVRGDRRIDLAYAVFALRFEDGRAVEIDFPEEGPYAAEIAVSQAIQATEPPPAWSKPGSTLREDQARVVAPALAWAAEKLGLPSP